MKSWPGSKRSIQALCQSRPGFFLSWLLSDQRTGARRITDSVLRFLLRQEAPEDRAALRPKCAARRWSKRRSFFLTNSCSQMRSTR
jgi:hypothetical protein